MIRMAGSVSKSWLAKQLVVAFDRNYYFDPANRHEVDRRCNQYVERTLPDLDVFYTESNLGRRQWYAPRQVLVGGIQPNMIVGMLLGAELLAADQADADITARCLASHSVDELPEPAHLLNHPLILQWDGEIAQLRSGKIEPIPPFFWDWSGRAAIHGSITSGLKFRGDGFLMSMISDPGLCTQLIDWLTEVNRLLVEHFAAVGRLEVTSIHVGECAACMLDLANFRRYVVPSASQLGEHFGAVRFHSCGCSDHLLEACGEITGLAELDVGGETSVGKIRSHFGSEFPVGIAPLVEDMRAASPRGILEWFGRVQRENAGGDLTIGFHLEADYRLENLKSLAAAVRDASRP